MEKFQKSVIGSGGRIADYTAKIAPYGDFFRVEDLQTILSSWNNILLTPTRTYTYDPEFGSDLYRYVFDPQDEDTRQEIRDEILYKLKRYDDRAQIVDLKIEYLTGQKGFTVSIVVDYEGQTGGVSFEIDESLYFNITGIE